MFTFSRYKNQGNEKKYNNQNMKLQFKTIETKLLQVSAFENWNDIAWKTQYHNYRGYARENRVHWCDVRLNGQ